MSAPLFRPLLPDTVLIAEMAPADADPAALPPAERSLIERAVEQRRLEFAAGRTLARGLLRDAGRPTDALLCDPDRVPRWPQNVVGSITHCRSLCAVAVAPRALSAGIGIDVEPVCVLDESLHPQILRQAEHARVQCLPAALRPLGALLVFSIKEAVYKAIYPERRQFLDFQQVEVLAIDEHAFEVEVLVPGASLPGLSRIAGRFRVADDHVASAVLLPPMPALTPISI